MSSLESKIFSLAQKLALQSGQLLLKRQGSVLKIDFKGRNNFVTDVDRASEQLIINGISSQFPDHDILAEESAPCVKGHEWLWIIDPLDGTTNYAHQFPMYCVSIAVWKNSKPCIGVVFDPVRSELFAACSCGSKSNRGAFLNKQRIAVSQVLELDQALLATGFAYNLKQTRNLRNFSRLTKLSQGIRRAGSAALDMCYVACGRLDGYWERGVQPWDTAAAAVVVQEAGGAICEMGSKPYTYASKSVVVANPILHPQLLQQLR